MKFIAWICAWAREALQALDKDFVMRVKGVCYSSNCRVAGYWHLSRAVREEECETLVAREQKSQGLGCSRGWRDEHRLVVALKWDTLTKADEGIGCTMEGKERAWGHTAESCRRTSVASSRMRSRKRDISEG